MMQYPTRRKVVLQVLLALLLIVSIPGQVFFVSAASQKPSYDYYLTGSSSDVTRTTSGGLLLMGGSTDVDAAFTWMINKAGGGDFVVIRVTGADGYNPYVYELGTVDSVETIVIKNLAAASDPFVVNTIRNADALFIAGGDQKDYVTLWKGTPVEDAIHYLVTRNVPIGGTSAGLAILGEFSFTAMGGTVDSSTALGNPYNRKVALENNFLVLPNMADVITDSHFGARDRMGRLVAFLGRIVQDGWAPVARGIGVDEMTALAVEPNGSATVLGSGSVYFLQTTGMPTVCQPKQPLTYHNLSVYRASGSATFNLSTWSGSGGTSYFLSADAGALSSTQAGGGIY